MNTGLSIEGFINFLLGLVVSLMGFVMKGQNDKIKTLENKMDSLPDIYARQDTMREHFDLIRIQLNRIEGKVDQRNG